MQTVKVLKRNSGCLVALKSKRGSGKLYVEKSTSSLWEFEAEREFFKHLNPESRHFPVFACQAMVGRRRGVLVTEFIDGESSHVMAAKANENQLKQMVRQLFDSLVEMHQMGFVHLDLHSNNILVTKDFQVKLIDCGYTKRIGSPCSHLIQYACSYEAQGKCPKCVDTSLDWWQFALIVSRWYCLWNHRNDPVNVNVYCEKFTPMVFVKDSPKAGAFPPSFTPQLRQFLALFFTIDSELRTFDSLRLQQNIKDHLFLKVI
jgi:serine/threonine protein kinase